MNLLVGACLSLNFSFGFGFGFGVAVAFVAAAFSGGRLAAAPCVHLVTVIEQPAQHRVYTGDKSQWV
jgi:hypothetical protein